VATQAGYDGAMATPRQAPENDANPVPASRGRWTTRAAMLVVFAAWTLWIWHDANVPAGENGSRALHHVLIPFHEAGHVLLGPFGRFVMTLGGSVGQLLMPIVLCVAMLRKRDAFGAALFFWLLGYSTLDMAVYMYDAFDPKLILLGGGTGAESDAHDWQNLFGDMGLLGHARGIGRFFGFLGRLAMVAALAWAALVLRRERARIGAAAT
jgi:hypothetical protein